MNREFFFLTLCSYAFHFPQQRHEWIAPHASSMQSAHAVTGLGLGHALLHGSASWLHGPPHHTGIDFAQQSSIEATNFQHQQLLCPGVSFPQQSWNSKNIYHEPWPVSDTTRSALESSIYSPGSDLFQPVATSRPALSDLSALSLPLSEPIKPAEAVVLQLPNGKFFCSQLGCDTVYPRAGDCRRHLKKHNGPFFHCDQPGCGMEFYRHDKLRAHLKQGHSIAVAAPRRGQRAANSSAYRVVKRGGNN